MSSRKTDVSPLTTFLRDKIIQLFFHFDCKRVVTHISGLYFGENIMKLMTQQQYRTSMAWTPLEQWKYVWDRDSLS